MAEPQFSRGDLVWFDPGIGYVLPGEVTEFHPQAQVSYFRFICNIHNVKCKTVLYLEARYWAMVYGLWRA